MDTPTHVPVANNKTPNAFARCNPNHTTSAKLASPVQPTAAPRASSAAAFRPRSLPSIPCFPFFCSCFFANSVALAGKIAGNASKSPPTDGPKCCAANPAAAVTNPPKRNRVATSFHFIRDNASNCHCIRIGYLRNTNHVPKATAPQTASAPLLTLMTLHLPFLRQITQQFA